MKEKYQLYVPANITIRSEFFKGFGSPELAKTAIVGAIGVAIAVLMFIIFDISILFCVLVVFASIGITVTVVTKYENNLSIVDHISIILKYHREQQRYYYKHLEEGEDIDVPYLIEK